MILEDSAAPLSASTALARVARMNASQALSRHPLLVLLLPLFQVATTSPVYAQVDPLTLTSDSFMDGDAISARHSCRGEDLQPQLSWVNAPAETMSFAIVLIDLSIDYVHWVAYDVPPDTSDLPEGASNYGQLPPGTLEARAYGTSYRGPCPTSTHMYSFRIYALDQPMTAFTAVNPIRDADLSAAFDAHTLARATLTGTFTP